MRPWVRLALIIIGFPIVSQSLARAKAPAVLAAAQTVVKPCNSSSEAYRDATARLTSVSAKIEALSPNDDPKPLVAELKAIGESPCFDVGGRMTQEPDSALSLQQYWAEGGKEWMECYLNLGLPGTDKTLWIEPTVARTVSRESSPQHPLRELLCSQVDETCKGETRAFRARAMRQFRLQSERTRLEEWQRATQEKRSTPPLEVDECAHRAMRAPYRDRFASFLACLESEPKVLSLPLVGLRRPKEGWLRISGRRGHYDFCDEQRAYDLATGSAFVVANCSQLALNENGSVDSRATDRQRSAKVTTGKVSREAISELTWFLLIEPELELRTESFGLSLPAGIAPMLPESTPFCGGGLSLCGSSGDTLLQWSYVLKGRTLASGSFMWPGCDSQQPHHYLVGLLEFAELTLEEGCTTAYPPAIVRRGELGAHLLDADKQSLDTAERELERGWQRARVPCTANPRNSE